MVGRLKHFAERVEKEPLVVDFQLAVDGITVDVDHWISHLQGPSVHYLLDGQRFVKRLVLMRLLGQLVPKVVLDRISVFVLFQIRLLDLNKTCRVRRLSHRVPGKEWQRLPKLLV